jgi:hypothetical protein
MAPFKDQKQIDELKEERPKKKGVEVKNKVNKGDQKMFLVFFSKPT